jgi:hypothetical protein
VRGTFDATGNFGIGTTAPANRLTVSGSTNITGDLGIGVTAPEAKLHVAAPAEGRTVLDTTTGFTNALRIPLAIRATTGGTMSDGFGSSMLFQAVDGDGTTRSLGLIGATRSAGSDLNGSLGFFAANDGSLVERMRISEVGAVGIGTTAPTARLHVTSAGATSPSLLVHNTSNGLAGRFLGTVEATALTCGSGPSALSLAASSVSTGGDLELSSGGSIDVIASDVLVDSATGVTLSADGDAVINGGASVSIAGGSTGAKVTLSSDFLGSAEFAAGTQGTARLTGALVVVEADNFNVAVTGRTAIGLDDPGVFMLAVNGNVAKPGGGAWSILSDARLKRNVEPLDGSLATLLSLNGVRFDYINGSHPLMGPGRQVGFIAQDVAKVMPEWVEVGEDGYLSIGIRGFEAMTVEALRELDAKHRAEIDALRATNATLEQRIEALEQALSALARPMPAER